MRTGLAGGLLGFVVLASQLAAQPDGGAAGGTNHIAVLTASLIPGENVGGQQVTRILLRSGTNELMFVLPEGLQAQALQSGKTLLTSRDMYWFLSVRMIGAPPPNVELKDALRGHIHREFAAPAGMEEFTTSVADHEGAGVQCRVALPDVGERILRTVWVPFPAGIIEFSLSANPSVIVAARSDFDLLLVSLRSNARGKIQIESRSDKT